jgi:ribonucleoside-triphosphate reductase
MKVIKRDDRREEFDESTIFKAIKKANNSKEYPVEKDKRITDDQIMEVVKWVVKKMPKAVDEISVEEIQDLVEDGLVHKNHTEVVRSFIKYREERAKKRFKKFAIIQAMEDKYSGKTWDKQNANIDGLSYDGKAGEAHGLLDKELALDYMITEKFAKNHRDMLVYIHDLDNYKKGKPNCLSFPADDYRDHGMTIKIPKDIRRAGSVSTESQLSLVELQSQSMPQFGGVSLTHWDFTLEPLANKDYFKFYKKNYERLTEIELDCSFGPRMSIDNPNYAACNEKAAKYAMEDLEQEVHQAMEGFLHNANTLQSRSGNQLPFTSVNYGTDTSAAGRLVTTQLLKAWEEGIGELGLSPIFPCGIFQYKKGINDKPGTPNYDLKQKAISVLPKRDYPNFANCDWSVQRKAFEKSQAVKEKVLLSLDEKDLYELTGLGSAVTKQLGFIVDFDEGDTYKITMNDTEQPYEMMSTMGCRTYNGFDINFTEDYFREVIRRTINDKTPPRDMLWSGIQKDGRGNIAPATVILPMIAMKAKQKSKDKPEYIVDCFLNLLEKYIGDAKDELIERFNWIAAQGPESSTFVYGNYTMKGYVPEEGIVSALKHGTLAIGQLGLAETLEILVGCDQCDPKGMEVAKRIEQKFVDKCNEYKEHYKLNFGVYYTPAENLCFTAFKAFKKKYGDVENVTYFINDNNERVEKLFFTNSIHVPVYKKISPFDKIDIESQLTGYSSAGCITYVEIGDDVKYNLKAIEQIIDYAMSKDIPYFALNFQINECTNCGNTDNLSEDVGVCPICGSRDINWLRRITGYLNGNYHTSFNEGKQREVELRQTHTKFKNIKFSCNSNVELEKYGV